MVELMIAVAIMGIMATLAVPVFNKYKYRARMSEAPTYLANLFRGEAAWEARRSNAVTHQSLQTTKDEPRYQGEDIVGCVYPRRDSSGGLKWPGPDPQVGYLGPDCKHLGFSPDGPLYFLYFTNSNMSSAMGGYFAYQNSAMQDLDGDGLYGFMDEQIRYNGQGELRRDTRVLRGDWDF